MYIRSDDTNADDDLLDMLKSEPWVDDHVRAPGIGTFICWLEGNNYYVGSEENNIAIRQSAMYRRLHQRRGLHQIDGKLWEYYESQQLFNRMSNLSRSIVS